MRGGKSLSGTGNFRRAFPDRQLIYRSRGEVRYFNLGWKSQTTIALAVTALCGWLGYSGIELAMMDDRLIAERERSEALLRSNDSLARRYASAQDQIASLNDGLAETEQLLLQARTEHRDLRYEIARLNASLVEAEIARRQSLDLFEGAESRKAQIEREISDLVARQAEILNRAGRQTDDEINTLYGSLKLTGLDIDGLLGRLLPEAAARADGVGGPFHSSASEVGARSSEFGPQKFGAPKFDSGAGIGAKAVDLKTAWANGTLGQWQEEGSLVQAALTRADIEPSGAFGAGVEALDSRFARLDAMRTLLRHLPLVRPTDTGRFSSSFGYRKDPYTGRRAFHSGLDIADDRGTSVLATASGKVIFAGRKIGYGNFVEIDHGFDITTRYAHLDRLMVSEGDIVDFRDKIGTMGSSGRSTGTHLHYEVRYQENALNPMNFIRAGRDVFRTSKKDQQKVGQWQVDRTAITDLERVDGNR